MVAKRALVVYNDSVACLWYFARMSTSIPVGSGEIVSFTGTRAGMTAAQEKTVERLFRSFANPPMGSIAHGNCIGADAQAHAIARRLNFTAMAWPANIAGMQALTDARVMAKPAPPLARNRKVVDAGGRLVAAPVGFGEELRSGTWATVRYARKRGKLVFVVWPDGTVNYG